MSQVIELEQHRRSPDIKPNGTIIHAAFAEVKELGLMTEEDLEDFDGTISALVERLGMTENYFYNLGIRRLQREGQSLEDEEDTPPEISEPQEFQGDIKDLIREVIGDIRSLLESKKRSLQYNADDTELQEAVDRLRDLHRELLLLDKYLEQLQQNGKITKEQELLLGQKIIALLCIKEREKIDFERDIIRIMQKVMRCRGEDVLNALDDIEKEQKVIPLRKY
jgi:hypothetical protein